MSDAAFQITSTPEVFVLSQDQRSFHCPVCLQEHDSYNGEYATIQLCCSTETGRTVAYTWLQLAREDIPHLVWMRVMAENARLRLEWFYNRHKDTLDEWTDLKSRYALLKSYAEFTRGIVL